jgi:hypothetical protein
LLTALHRRKGITKKAEGFNCLRVDVGQKIICRSQSILLSNVAIGRSFGSPFCQLKPLIMISEEVQRPRVT